MNGTKASLVKKKSVKKHSKTFYVVIALVSVILLTTICGCISYRYVIESIKDKDREVVISIDPAIGIPVEIPYNSDTTKIANILKQKGIIRYPYLFKILSKFNGYDGMYQSGTHILARGLDYDRIMRILTSKPESIRVTIPEGYTYRQIKELLYGKRLIDMDKFDAITNTAKFDYEFLSDVPQRDQRLEGYLFPDTYEFDMKAGEKEIIRRMLENFNQKFQPSFYKKAKALGMNADQIIILASIIEREARQPDERRIIAGIFYKRLDSKNGSLKKLQSCATLQYIFYTRDGKYKEIITESDTRIPDPYNTYQNEGLPPGPICCPGMDSIEAALNPIETDYLYFVAKGDGYHQFSKTYEEHQAAVKQYGIK